MDNIRKHKDDIVISAIWSGTKSRNRKSKTGQKDLEGIPDRLGAVGMPALDHVTV